MLSCQNGQTARAKALLALLIKEIKIDGKLSARCTYRLPREGEVRVQTGQVEAAESNPRIIPIALHRLRSGRTV